MTQSFDFLGAVQARREASIEQQEASRAFAKASADLAAAERDYRILLSQHITKLHADGVAWTTCETLAKGDERVANLRFQRDLARGQREAAFQNLRRLDADRRDLGRLLEWSRGIDLRSSGGQSDAPASPGYRSAA